MQVHATTPPAPTPVVPMSMAAAPRICIHSLGTVLGLPAGLDEPTSTEGADVCTICRLPLVEAGSSSDASDTHTKVVCLEPCKHRFHASCFRQTTQMHRDNTAYSGNGMRRPHCPLCRTATTTRVGRPKAASSGCHRRALAPASSPVLKSLLMIPETLSDAWQLAETAALPITAEELIPLTGDDERWSTFVQGHTPLYMPAHGVHGILEYTTKTMVAVRVYPSKTVRRFGKHKVAAVAESWGESA